MWAGQQARCAALQGAWVGLGEPASFPARAAGRDSAAGVTSPPWRIGPVSVDHYENFPVASWLCPPALRPPIVAIYRYARTADDLADEGDTPAARRLADLVAY